MCEPVAVAPQILIYILISSNPHILRFQEH
jgi:hypothetical protein